HVAHGAWGPLRGPRGRQTGLQRVPRARADRERVAVPAPALALPPLARVRAHAAAPDGRPARPREHLAGQAPARLRAPARAPARRRRGARGLVAVLAR